MRIDSLFYRFAYGFGKPRWDTAEPQPELRDVVKDLRPGRALDLGCGTGANAIYLASCGWEVVGVDFVPKAVSAARAKALAVDSSATFVVGDVTDLSAAEVDGAFDLVMDIGCYHALPERLRASYAREVIGTTRPGADLYLAGISNPPATWRLLGARGVTASELVDRFGTQFDLVNDRLAGTIGRASNFVLYHLRRRTTPTGH